jgi:hypothetical protein
MRNMKPRIFASAFRAQLRKATRAGAPFLFINAWNEWAEGTYLEPDEARGTFFLEAIRSAVSELQTPAREAASVGTPRGSSGVASPESSLPLETVDP